MPRATSACVQGGPACGPELEPNSAGINLQPAGIPAGRRWTKRRAACAFDTLVAQLMSSDLSPRRILVVDARDDCASMLADLLRLYGYETLTARNGYALRFGSRPAEVPVAAKASRTSRAQPRT